MKTKKAISMRIDREIIAEIDKAVEQMNYPNRSFVIEGILANAVTEMKGDELYRYAVKGLKKIPQM